LLKFDYNFFQTTAAALNIWRSLYYTHCYFFTFILFFDPMIYLKNETRSIYMYKKIHHMMDNVLYCSMALTIEQLTVTVKLTLKFRCFLSYCLALSLSCPIKQIFALNVSKCRGFFFNVQFRHPSGIALIFFSHVQGVGVPAIDVIVSHGLVCDSTRTTYTWIHVMCVCVCVCVPLGSGRGLTLSEKIHCIRAMHTPCTCASQSKFVNERVTREIDTIRINHTVILL